MSYDLMFRRAIELHEQGEFDKAEQLYRQILETLPENPDILNLLGLIAQVKGVHEEAAGLFYRAIKADGKRAPFYFNLGISLNCWSKPYEAIEAFSNALKYEPQMKEAWLQIGHIRHDLGQTNQAKNAYEQALKIDDKYCEALIGQIMLTPENAISKLQELKTKFPNEPQIDFELSRLFLDKQDYSNTLLHAQNAAAAYPDNPEVQTVLGQAMLGLGQIGPAETNFNRALELDANNILAHLNLADIKTWQQDYNSAEKHYLRVLELGRNNFAAHLNYATLLYKEHRLSEALEEFRQAIIINPKSAEASNNLGLILKDLQEYEEALGLFFNAYALNPELEEVSVNLSETLMLYHQKDADTAVKIAENWLRQAPNNIFAARTTASLKGIATNSADNKTYAEKLFDNFAEHYDNTLHQINYQLPQAFSKYLGEIRGLILDLGCGTGLLGETLKKPHNQIIGVDISEAMLQQAQNKNIYQELINRDILAYLDGPHPTFDLITAADVFCYISDLTPIIQKCFPNRLCFSIEIGDNTNNWQLSPQGRYKHSLEYVNKLLSTTGYNQIDCHHLTLRNENTQEVKGAIFIAATTKENAHEPR